MDIKYLRKACVYVCEVGSNYVLYVFNASCKKLLYVSLEVESLNFGYGSLNVSDPDGVAYRMCLNFPRGMVIRPSDWNGKKIVARFTAGGWLVNDNIK